MTNRVDIADLYKADYTIPLAFDLAAAGHVNERDARTAFRDRVTDGRLMAQVVRDIKDLLLGEGTEPIDSDINELWDEAAGSVPGGVNWAADYAEQLTEDLIIGVTGPDVDPSKQVDW